MNIPKVILAFLTLLIALPCSAASGGSATAWSIGASERRTNLLIYPDQKGETKPVRSRRDWQKRRVDILERMQTVMGPYPGRGKRAPLEIQFGEKTDKGDYTLQRISYLSEPDSRVEAWLLVPKKTQKPRARFPAVLCLHQTSNQGSKVVVGLAGRPDDEYAVELVKLGFVCIAPSYPHLADYAPDLQKLGYRSGTMKAIWDNSRALDVLDSLDFVKHGKYGTIGHSLGGHNGIFTAAFDTRLKVIVSSCGFDSFEDYMGGNLKGWAQERYMPRLADYPSSGTPFDFYEIIAGLAPRRVFVSAPLHDSNFKHESVRKIERQASTVFQLLKKPQNLKVVYPDSAHRFPPEIRQQAYAVLKAELDQ